MKKYTFEQKLAYYRGLNGYILPVKSTPVENSTTCVGEVSVEENHQKKRSSEKSKHYDVSKNRHYDVRNLTGSFQNLLKQHKRMMNTPIS